MVYPQSSSEEMESWRDSVLLLLHLPAFCNFKISKRSFLGERKWCQLTVIQWIVFQMYLFIWKTERLRKTFHLLVYSQVPVTTGAGPGWSRELGVSLQVSQGPNYWSWIASQLLQYDLSIRAGCFRQAKCSLLGRFGNVSKPPETETRSGEQFPVQHQVLICNNNKTSHSDGPWIYSGKGTGRTLNFGCVWGSGWGTLRTPGV